MNGPLRQAAEIYEKRNLLRIKFATVISLFLAHWYATVVIILLDEMGSDHRPV